MCDVSRVVMLVCCVAGVDAAADSYRPHLVIRAVAAAVSAREERQVEDGDAARSHDLVDEAVREARRVDEQLEAEQRDEHEALNERLEARRADHGQHLPPLSRGAAGPSEQQEAPAITAAERLDVGGAEEEGGEDSDRAGSNGDKESEEEEGIVFFD